jgi:hypothetical protein
MWVERATASPIFIGRLVAPEMRAQTKGSISTLSFPLWHFASMNIFYVFDVINVNNVRLGYVKLGYVKLFYVNFTLFFFVKLFYISFASSGE